AKSDGGTGALNQMVVAEYFGTHFETHRRTLTSRLERKLDVMMEALDREFGTAAKCTRPEGGIFVWVTIEGVDTSQLVKPAAEAGLVFNTGRDWAVEPPGGTSSMRLCFALPSE